MIRVGLVGLGGVSKVHIDAYRELPDVTLVAAADITGEAAKSYGQLEGTGARLYTSLDDLLENEKIDVLDICTPTYLHAEMVTGAMERGIHVLSEKPMARTSADGERILAAAERTGVRYMTAHVVRFMKPYAYLRGIVRSGEFGKPVHFMLRRLSSAPLWSYENWLLTPEKSGGAPLDLAIHDIDFVYSVFGEPRDISATYRTFSGDRNDCISASFLYDGFSVDVTGTFYQCNYPFTAEFTAVFENGYVELKGGRLTRNGAPVDLATAATDGRDIGINISSDSAYTEEIAYFLNAVRTGAPTSLVTPESALGTIRLIERTVANAKRV